MKSLDVTFQRAYLKHQPKHFLVSKNGLGILFTFGKGLSDSWETILTTVYFSVERDSSRWQFPVSGNTCWKKNIVINLSRLFDVMKTKHLINFNLSSMWMDMKTSL